MKEKPNTDQFLSLSDSDSERIKKTDIARPSKVFSKTQSRSTSSAVIQNELRNFIPHCKNSSKNRLKFKNFRVKVLRSFINIIKSITMKREYKNRLGSSNKIGNAKYEKLEKFINEQEGFHDVERTISAPIRNPRFPRTIEFNIPFKTFSNSFIENMNKNEVILKGLKLFLKFLFGRGDPDVLCREFKFRCCTIETHENIKCIQKWTHLGKHLLEQGL